MFNRYYKSAQIVELANAFEDCTLPPETLTHEIFLTIAFWHLFFNSPTEAQLLICESIKRYNFEHNISPTAKGAYHETLILFWVRMISIYMERVRTKQSFLEIANDILRRFKDKNLPLRFYSREKLFSDRARADWIEPDLIFEPQRRTKDCSPTTLI